MPQYATGDSHFLYGCNDNRFIYEDDEGYETNDCGRRKNEHPQDYEKRVGHPCPGYEY